MRSRSAGVTPSTSVRIDLLTVEDGALYVEAHSRQVGQDRSETARSPGRSRLPALAAAGNGRIRG